VYNESDQLPIKLCDKGPLVEKFVALLVNYVNYDNNYGYLNLGDPTENRFTPDIARFILEYRYRRNLLPVVAEIDDSVISELGSYWYPDESSAQFKLFDYFCKEGDPYLCERFGFIFPTEECPAYRIAPDQVFPLKKCDYGNWINYFSNALRGFDGQEFLDELGIGLFDTNMEDRVKKFQLSNGLDASGQIDLETWTKILGVAEDKNDDWNSDGVYGPGDMVPE
jgi:hypothetical protein